LVGVGGQQAERVGDPVDRRFDTGSEKRTDHVGGFVVRNLAAIRSRVDLRAEAVL